jgi:hypothetical protein
MLCVARFCERALNSLCQDSGAFRGSPFVRDDKDFKSAFQCGLVALRSAELLATSMFPPQGAENGCLPLLLLKCRKQLQ